MAKKNIFTKDEIQEIISKYKNGKSLRQLATEYKYSRNTLSKIIKENEVIVRDNKINSRKYYHDENYFESIDTEEKAYWLGFIFADGFIESKRLHSSQKFGITLSVIDKEHLEKFKKSLNATNEIKIYKGSGFNSNGEFAKLLLTSQKTVDDLKSKGCVEQKTLKLRFPNIPQELKKHFIRGYIDGDGSINFSIRNNKRNYYLGIVGTKEFLTEINNYFEKDNKMSTKDNITFQLNYSGNKQVRKFLDHLYKDSTIYLDRKYEKYLDFIKYSES